MFDFRLKKDHKVLPDFRWKLLQCHNTGKYCGTTRCTAWRTTRILTDQVVSEGEVIPVVTEGFCVELWETPTNED